MTPRESALEAVVDGFIKHHREGGRPYTLDLLERAERALAKAPSAVVEAPARESLLAEALEMMWDRYENGDPCFDEADDPGGCFIGNAVRLDSEEEYAVLALIPKMPTKPSAAERLSAEHKALKASAARLREVLRKLTFAARTSGGTAGPDAGLMEACDIAERLLAESATTGKEPGDG